MKNVLTGITYHDILFEMDGENMTKGQLEAKICEIVSKFEIEYMGRGPKTIKAYILNDLIVVRLTGFLSPSEQKLTDVLLTSANVLLLCGTPCTFP